MCGRFGLYASVEKIKSDFNVNFIANVPPRYNIAPTQNILILIQEQQGLLHGENFRWGFIPAFAKTVNDFPALINARAESLISKPTFRNSFKSKRGIIIMNGYFEWLPLNRGKKPFYISSKTDKLLAIAALWDSWVSTTGYVINSCCMVTVPANKTTEKFHNRMPAILSSENQKIWLDNNNYDPDHLFSVLEPCESITLQSYPVTSKMNNWCYENIDVIRALE